MTAVAEAEEKQELSGIRKSAIVLLMLGEEASAEILKHLDDGEVQHLGQEIARMSSVTSEIGEQVLEQFHQMTLAHEYVLRGGVSYARKILISAFGPEHAGVLLDRLMKTLGSESGSFDALQKADPQQLAKFIHGEHPQTIALILCNLNPAQAAALLTSLPVEIRSDVALRMSNLDQISPDIIARIANIISQKLKSLGIVDRKSYGGVRAVAEMFNRLDTKSSREILDNIEGDAPELVETVRQLMFVFEDLLALDQNAIKEVLTRVDKKILTLALKGTSENLKGHFLQCMSQRGAEMMKEDLDSLGPVKIKEVESGQQQIIAVVRQLESEGVISMRGGGSDQYVD